MKKRSFCFIVLSLLLLSGMVVYSTGIPSEEAEEGIIMTVRGPIYPKDFGKALTHEHIVGIWGNLDELGEVKYDPDDVIEAMLPSLLDLKFRGFTGLAEPSTVDLGRQVEVLRRLADLSNMHILTNTGHYSAAGNMTLLSYAYTDTADQLAARWVKEWKEGIDGTGIKPGFIKIGVDPGPLDEIDRKMVRAAARAHLQTGLIIQCHTGEKEAALDVLEMVRGEGVDPSALIIIHSHNIPDRNVHFQLAEAGAWVSYDNGNKIKQSIDDFVELIKAMLEKGYGDRLLLSHDGGWFDVSQPDGGTMRNPYTPIDDLLIPALRAAGVSNADLRQLFVENPADALTVKVRKR